MADQKVLSLLLRAMGAAQTAREVKKVDDSVGSLTKRAGTFATNLKGNVSNALGTFKGRITQLGGAMAGLLGVGGILGIGGLIGKSVQEAADFGANVQLVARSTGLALPVASAMVDTLDKWGLSSERLIPMLGKLEKNVGAIAMKKNGLAEFRKEFGMSLTMSNGKIADANVLLLRSADYFNSNATATQKATVLSRLWGKNWQDMIPVLAKGSKFIKQQERDSIHLTQQQLDNITHYRTAQREFQDSLGDTEVKIGSVIMPLLTTGLVAVTKWLDAHQDDVATWFQNAAGVVGQIAGTAIDVIGAIQSGWDAIPEPLRNLIVTGLVADRAMKFLFGFSPASLAIKLGVDVLGGIAGAVAKSAAGALIGAGIGKAFVQPVFVTNPGFGGGGGGVPGAVAGAAEGVAAGAIIDTILAAGLVTAVGAAAMAFFFDYLPEKFKTTGPLPTYKTGTPVGDLKPGTPTSNLIHQGNPNFYNLLNQAKTPVSAPVPVKLSKTDESMFRNQEEAQQTWIQKQLRAADTTSEKIGTLHSQLQIANAKLQAIEDKRETNRINVTLKTAASTVVRVTVGGVNRAQTTFKVYGSGSAGLFAS